MNTKDIVGLMETFKQVAGERLVIGFDTDHIGAFDTASTKRHFEFAGFVNAKSVLRGMIKDEKVLREEAEKRIADHSF
jgi:hypothetical protein